MTEAFATIHALKDDYLPTVADVTAHPSQKDKRDAALLALGYDETTTSIPSSAIVSIIEADDGFLFPTVCDRVEELITNALELQTRIAALEAVLVGRTIPTEVLMSEEEQITEPWSYVEDVTFEEHHPDRLKQLMDFYDDRWREIIVLTNAEKRLKIDVLREEKRLAALTKELEKIQNMASVGIAEVITIESEEGVA